MHVQYRVYVDAVADLYHIGHVNFLNAAYEQGIKCAEQKYFDAPQTPPVHLIVGIHNDKTVACNVCFIFSGAY